MGTTTRIGTLLGALGLMHASAAAAQETRNVLVVFSNSRLLPANIELERGLRETFAKSADRHVEIFAEFLDVPHFGGDAYNDTVATYLREKYAARPPSVIVAAAEGALEFFLRHRDQLFPRTPIVHMAVSRSCRPCRPTWSGSRSSTTSPAPSNKLWPGIRRPGASSS